MAINKVLVVDDVLTDRTNLQNILSEAGYQVAAAATSYVATQVLVKQLDLLGVDVRTIARHLQLTVEYDGPKQNYVFSE